MHGTQCMFTKLMQDKYGYTALVVACRRGHVETARVLLDHGANVDHQNNVSNRTQILAIWLHLSSVSPNYVE